MKDAAWLAVPLALLIWSVLLNGGKKTSWIPIRALIKVQKTSKGTTFSVTAPKWKKRKR